MSDKEIEQFIEQHDFTVRVKIYFKNNRLPLYGKFVKMKDDDEIWNKGFVRFVPEQRIEPFEKLQAISLTRLIQLNVLEYIKPVYTQAPA